MIFKLRKLQRVLQRKKYWKLKTLLEGPSFQISKFIRKLQQPEQCGTSIRTERQEAAFLYVCKNRHTDKWKWSESPEVNLNIYGQLIFNKQVNSIQMWKNESLQQMVQGQLNNHMQKNKVRPLPHSI